VKHLVHALIVTDGGREHSAVIAAAQCSRNLGGVYHEKVGQL
jgi:hypothetical protein